MLVMYSIWDNFNECGINTKRIRNRLKTINKLISFFYMNFSERFKFLTLASLMAYTDYNKDDITGHVCHYKCFDFKMVLFQIHVCYAIDFTVYNRY